MYYLKWTVSFARQGCWAINELAGEFLLRYDRNQEVASRIVCEAINKALLYDSVKFSFLLK
jgi:hypothetical protein